MGFAYHRYVATGAEQNKVLAEKQLQMRTLALGGDGRVRKNSMMTMEKLAGTVCGGQIESCGHLMMEEQPGEVARILLDFFEGGA
jgi:pimeloyl-ACP methyl ester carboxylesterase